MPNNRGPKPDQNSRTRHENGVKTAMIFQRNGIPLVAGIVTGGADLVAKVLRLNLEDLVEAVG